MRFSNHEFGDIQVIKVSQKRDSDKHATMRDAKRVPCCAWESL